MKIRQCQLSLTELVVFALLALVNSSPSFVNKREDIFVIPSNNTACPGEPCYTFIDLISLTSWNHGLNATIHFLKGRHYAPQGAFTSFGLVKINHIELVGEYSTDFHSMENATTLIECARPFIFVFGYNDYIRISHLNFKNCGATIHVIKKHDATIYVGNCKNVSIERVSITGGQKAGIAANYVEHLNIAETIISDTGGSEPLSIFYVSNAFLTNMTSKANHGHFGLMVSKVTIQGYTLLHQNKRTTIVGIRSNITFDTNSATVIKNNTEYSTGRLAGIVTLLATTVTFSKSSSLMFENNSAKRSGGIEATRSQLIFDSKSKLTFLRNAGVNGGGLALYEWSAMYFMSNDTTIQFIENRAQFKGGAIFVEDLGYVDFTFREVSTPIALCKGNQTPTVQLINNTAGVAGDEIYGGWVDWPDELFTNTESRMLRYTFDKPHFNGFNVCHRDNWLEIHNDYNGVSTVSSNPLRICMCIDGTPNCTIWKIATEVFPGQMLVLDAVAVGQRHGTVPATVVADFSPQTSVHTEFELGQNVQLVSRYCSRLQYTILTQNKKATFLLFPDNGKGNPVLRRAQFETIDVSDDLVMLFQDLIISVDLLACPLGAVFDYGGNRCACHPTFLENGILCNTDDYSIQRPLTKWINATFEHIVNGTDYGILVHNNCPFDYCYSKDTTINLESPQDQCDFNRSDILCGACQNNFSHVFGTSRCKKCSNLWVLLIVPTVILAGIALVVFLMILDFTVSIGTINGLIFYANIVRANQAVFFPTKEANTFLNVFIAWLNLDLGVETCFYNGLNAYTKTWLQFIFPFYIWLLVSLIIISSHYSSTVSRWSGSNAVQVLATLFLLSYVKLLRLIITVFLYTTITYPDGYTRRVWLYDGNVNFLKGEHIPLFITALLTLVILTVPYTTTLTTIQWLQRHKSCKRALFWVHKFKPIFDAHTGPYKPKHRYWTGLLLLVRVALLLVFTVNLSGDPSVNLLAITVTVNCLSMYLLFIGGPYRSKMINLIEISFYFNACILSTTTIYRLKIESSSTAITTISTSIAFVIFTLIVLYHVMERITETRRGAKLKHSIMERVTALGKQSAPVINIITGQGGPIATPSEVSHSSIELKEPLLANVVQVKQD